MNRRPRLPFAPRPASPLLAGVVASAILTLTTPAQAAQWQSLSGSTKGASGRIEVDLSSIDRSKEGKVSLWHRQTHASRQLQEAWAFTYRSLKQQSEFDCGKRLVTPLQRIYLADDGSELKNERLGDAEAQAVVPETALERVFAYACRKPGGKGTADEEAEPEKPAAPPPPPPPPPLPSGPVPWSYSGKTGPEHWGKLSTDYATCAGGKWQSPIDIRNPIRADLPPIRFVWKSVPLAIIDTGHTIQVNVDDGGHTVIEGVEYALQSFRFRRPGEEMANGQRAAMSVQFELRSKSGQTAILAVPLVEGKENRLIRTLWNALPLEPGKLKTPGGPRIDPGLLIPQQREYSTYVGSLTAPPCTEGVLWLVMKHPVTLSKEQIGDFARIHANNARPVQPANGRIVKSSR